MWGGKVDAVGDDYIKFRLSSFEVAKFPALLKKLDQNKNVWIGDKRKKNIWDRRRNIDRLESVNEGKWSKIMTSVRKGSKSGPWSIVVYKNKKVKHQRLVKILQQIPAHYEDVKKKYPRDKIGIEDKYGERVYTESINEDIGIDMYLGGIVKALQRAGIKPKTAKVMKHGFSKSKDKIGFFIDVLDRKREKYTLQLEVDRDGNLWYLSAPRDMKLGKWADESKIVRSLKVISKLPDFGQSSLKRR